MTIRSSLRKALAPYYRRHPHLKAALKQADAAIDLARHTAASAFPGLIRPMPRYLYLSLTADCNLRCKACSYGRDFMPGHQLSLPMVKDLVDDAKAAGFERIRLYGGEPLIHKDLVEMVRHIAARDIDMWMTTNAVLLKQRADPLIDAGLRHISIGLYGTGTSYDDYVQRPKRFGKVEDGVAHVRERYGKDVSMHLDWLLMRPTSSERSLQATWEFAKRYDLPIHVNLIHYSLPYFLKGHELPLQFRPEDRPLLQDAVDMLLEFKADRPDLIVNSAPGLRSIPDWLIKGPKMRVPCTEYQLIWVGPDGTVQMCYVTFKLGNLHEKRLSELLFSRAHAAAARDAYSLNCPNCHCNYDKRVLAHPRTRAHYSAGRA